MSLLTMVLGCGLLTAAPSFDAPKGGPVDPKASAATRALFRRLQESAGKAMISGQTDFPDAQWVGKETGRLPVILCLDFLSTPTSAGAKRENTQEAIDWVTKRKGIVTYQWHWISPGPKERRSFYTKETDFDLEKTLADPKSEDYRSLLQDIDDVATELKKMERAGVPVLFRPLHEAQGRWFWWGAKGAKPCVDLYRLIFDRMTKKHALHNLLWVWNVYPASQDKGNPMEWYPGDAMVDVLATDYLDSPADYAALRSMTKADKIFGVAETMNPPDPAKLIREGAPWSYWVTWARRDWNDRSAKDVASAMNHPQTLTLPAGG